jgi:hypothetical protein
VVERDRWRQTGSGFGAGNQASWRTAHSAARRGAVLTETDGWIWRSAERSRNQALSECAGQAGLAGAAGGAAGEPGWGGRNDGGWFWEIGWERRGRFTAVRVTGRRTAWCRSWAARKRQRRSGSTGRAAKTTTSPIPTGAKEIAVDMEGKLTVNQKEP